MDNKNTTDYQSPLVTFIEVSIERGFATSPSDFEFDGDGWSQP